MPIKVFLFRVVSLKKMCLLLLFIAYFLAYDVQFEEDEANEMTMDDRPRLRQRPVI